MASQQQICFNSFTCCHSETEDTDQNCYLYQNCYLAPSQYFDTWPTSPSTEPETSDIWLTTTSASCKKLESLHHNLHCWLQTQSKDFVCLFVLICLLLFVVSLFAFFFYKITLVEFSLLNIDPMRSNEYEIHTPIKSQQHLKFHPNQLRTLWDNPCTSFLFLKPKWPWIKAKAPQPTIKV